MTVILREPPGSISAYDKAIADFHGAPVLVWEVIAKHIIDLIAHGERDADLLYQRALLAAGIPDEVGQAPLDKR
jgi:hypothetical protein